MKILRMPYRSWFYFRIGYGTYLTFMIASINVLVTTYYLALQNIPILSGIFTNFTLYVVIVTLVGVPLTILIGWLHMKRTAAWSSELDIQVEANPYNYKLPPGYWKEAFAPLYLEILVLLTKILEKEGLLEAEEKKRIRVLQDKLKILAEGGLVGTPKRKL